MLLVASLLVSELGFFNISMIRLTYFNFNLVIHSQGQSVMPDNNHNMVVFCKAVYMYYLDFILYLSVSLIQSILDRRRIYDRNTP